MQKSIWAHKWHQKRRVWAVQRSCSQQNIHCTYFQEYNNPVTLITCQSKVSCCSDNIQLFQEIFTGQAHQRCSKVVNCTAAGCFTQATQAKQKKHFISHLCVCVSVHVCSCVGHRYTVPLNKVAGITPDATHTHTEGKVAHSPIMWFATWIWISLSVSNVIWHLIHW